jgi:hypothetical protein
MRAPGEKKDDGTFYWGDHGRVVRRPPRRDGHGRPNTDPEQNSDVERWECLDCGLTTQADRGLGVTFSSRDCPPELPDHGDASDSPGNSGTAPCDPAELDDDLEGLARRLAADADIPAGEVAGRVQNLDEFHIPAEEIERTLQKVLANDDGGGEQDGGTDE